MSELEKWAHGIAIRAVVGVAVARGRTIGPDWEDPRAKLLAEEGYTAALKAAREFLRSQPEEALHSASRAAAGVLDRAQDAR